ncbi:MAG: hypothetical protein HY606_11380 [Planctomycetes bacterium]|nr:hypothetical protein [Planctomycetota bacterium]
MKSITRQLWERHKNPLSWTLRPFFAVILYYGVWSHSWTLIAIAIIGLSTSWFWFPKPINTPIWAEQLIDKELEWMKNKKKNLIGVLSSIIVIGSFFWVLYNNYIIPSTVILIVSIAGKLIWCAKLDKNAAIPLTVLVLASYAITSLGLFIILQIGQ